MVGRTNDTGGVLDYALIAAQTPAWIHYIIGTVLLVAAIASVLTNGSVVTVLLITDRNQLTRTNFFIAAICILNFSIAVLGIPMDISCSFDRVWLFGSIGCQYYGFIMSFCGLSTMLLLCVISIDRYIFVVRMDLSRRLENTHNMAAIVVCLLISFSFALAPLVGWNQYVFEGIGTSCAIDLIGTDNNGRPFVMTLLVLYFAVPLMIMCFCYGAVYTKVITETHANLRSMNRGTNQSERSKALSMEKELAITVTIIIGFFLLCYTPYASLLMWKVINPEVNLHPILMAIPSKVTKIGGVFTPIVYLGKNKPLRTRASRLFTRHARVGNIMGNQNGPQTRVSHINMSPLATRLKGDNSGSNKTGNNKVSNENESKM